MMLSIIVPLAPGDESWRVLLQDLAALDERRVLNDYECLFMVADDNTQDALTTALPHHDPGFAERVQLCVGGDSRAKSMNAGATQARGEYLWFVHADSRLAAQHINALQQSIAATAIQSHAA